MRTLLLALTCALLAAGCSQGPKTEATTSAKPPSESGVLALTGPGGEVKIGDTLDQAKKAFPPPKGAKIFQTAMSFAILGTEGWTWGSETGAEAFEAAVKDGKIVALARTGGDTTGEPAKTIAVIGEPTRKAIGKSADVYVWEAGDKARFWLHMKAKDQFLPLGMLTAIGGKEDLKLLNYHSDDPETFVKQMDSAMEQMNSPEMKKMFEDAKRKAQKK